MVAGRDFDTERARAQFPALKLRVGDAPAIFFDGPGGTQVPQAVIDAVRDYYAGANANCGGQFETSRRNDAAIAAARGAMADLLHCAADEIVFGANMTSLTFALARAIGRELAPGDEIIVTTLDHDANVAPWRALEERGAVIRQVDIREADCTLDLDDLRRKLSRRTRLVAVGYASNAVGTINPVAQVARLAREAGALVFVDAVHYAPHGLIDVRALDCDFLACSPYKFFGPHLGVLHGRRALLDRLRPYKVRPSSDEAPNRWETGTQGQELLAALPAAVDYIAGLAGPIGASAAGRRAALEAAFERTMDHERALAVQLVQGLQRVPGARIFGIVDPGRFDERCATVSFEVAGRDPEHIARALGERGVFAWNGNCYAIGLSERLGVEERGGFVRVGLVHYNTAEEVERFLAALRAIAR
jgi:cysteine desulfurase family protein (TIGR01976 family)